MSELNSLLDILNFKLTQRKITVRKIKVFTNQI